MNDNDRVDDILAALGMAPKQEREKITETAGDLIKDTLGAFDEEASPRKKPIQKAGQIPLGEIALITKIVDDKTCEVDFRGASRLVLFGDSPKKPEIGDRVVLDVADNAIKHNLGPENDRFSFTGDTQVSWGDIGGLEDAKKAMIGAIEMPFKHPEIFEHYGEKPPKGILLFGPPGCGKTMFGKATATAIAKIQKAKGAASGFIYVKGPELLDPHIGVTETTIRQLFMLARKHKEKYGYPAVLFVDEADALLPKRGTVKSSDVERTIVPMFLAEMDGLSESCAIVLLATNRPDTLDPAVVRDGRVDQKIRIGRPDKNSSKDVFKIYLSKVPVASGITKEELIELATDELFSPDRVLYQIQLGEKRGNRVLDFTLGNLASGAMIATIVAKARQSARDRDIESGTKTGITKEEVLRAIAQTFEQQGSIDHADDLEDFLFVNDVREDVVNIKKIKPR